LELDVDFTAWDTTGSDVPVPSLSPPCTIRAIAAATSAFWSPEAALAVVASAKFAEHPGVRVVE
jgi:hypothetical protein